VTTPAGVPNLPIGALTVATLGQQLQDQTAEAMRARAGERVPNIFANTTGGDILNDLSPFGILTNIWAGINSLIATSDPADIQGPEDLPPLLMDFIEGLPVIGQFVQLLESILGTYDGDDPTLQNIQEVLAPIVQFFSGLITEFGSLAEWVGSLASGGLSTVMQALEDFLTGIPNLSTWLATFKTLIDKLLGIVNLSTFLDTFKTLVSGLTGIANFSNWVDGFKTLVTYFNTLVTAIGSTVWTILTEIITHFSGVFTGAGSVAQWLANVSGNLLSVIGTLTGGAVSTLEEGIAKLTQFTQSLPNIGSLISAIMGNKKNPATGTNTTIPDLIWWASQLLFSTSALPSFNLTGLIPSELLALIGVGNIGNVAPNLITDAGFGSEATLQAGVGWTWDATVNSTGSSGGAAKLLCDGGVKYMFSNLIAAAPGQQLTISVKTKYTKGSTATANIIAAVRTYNGATVKATDTVASLAAPSGRTTSIGASGADAAGFTTITGTYTVPAGVDTVRLVLGVTTGTSGTTVWFDEASMAKTSLLPQDLVHNLGNTIEALLPLDQFNTLLDSVADTTGATIQQVKDVLDGKLTSDSQLNGSNITIGNISAEVIAELKETWAKFGGSVSGSTSTAPTTITGAAAEFASLVNNITGLSSLIGGNSRDIFNLGSTVNGHTTLISGIDSKLQTYSSTIADKIKTVSDDSIKTADSVAKLQARVVALETKTSTTPPAGTNQPVVVPPPVTAPTTTPTAPPPTPVSVSDDFERAELGGNWSVSSPLSNGSTLGILNAHDAYMATPTAANAENRIAAIYVGTGSASIGEYQKISATLGTKAGIPLVGTQGSNDLIGRAANATRCIFARFFPDGRVWFGYRNGSWTDQIIGTFTAPKQLTGATPIEFFVGDKTVSDQTKLYARVGGTSIIGPCYIGAGALATMGRGWGFAMGHGLSDGTFTFGYGAPQVPATMNFWAAQEQ
jgi:hypothetical protein